MTALAALLKQGSDEEEQKRAELTPASLIPDRACAMMCL